MSEKPDLLEKSHGTSPSVERALGTTHRRGSGRKAHASRRPWRGWDSVIDCRRNHVSLASARLSFRLLDMCFACTFECTSILSFSPSPITHYPTTLLSVPHSPLMSLTHPTPTSSSFQLILDNALKVYKRRTKNDLLKHPLADRLQACDSPHSILTVLQEQVQELNQSQRSHTKWLDPTVNVLHTFSEALGEGVGSVC